MNLNQSKAKFNLNFVVCAFSLGDAFLKYSTTIFLFYKMTEACDEGDLSSARSRIVGNRNLRIIAKNLGLPNCGIVSNTFDVNRSWVPPGYKSENFDDYESLEDKVVDLDSKMETWQVGQLCKYVSVSDMKRLQLGEITEDQIIDIIRNKKKKHEVVVKDAVPLRGYRILSDKVSICILHVTFILNLINF